MEAIRGDSSVISRVHLLGAGGHYKMAEVWLVASKDLAKYWERIVHAYVEYPGTEEVFTIEELATALLSSNTQLWAMVDDNYIEGLIVTVLIPYPKKVVLHIASLACGDLMKYIVDGLQRIEQYAAVIGVTEVTFDSHRPGFERVMKKFGYHRTLRMHKDVRVMWGMN